MFKAIIIGGTGATGKQLLNQLIREQQDNIIENPGKNYFSSN